MRHKIELKSNNLVEYDSKQLGSKNTWIAPIVNSLHTLHPSIQSKYDDEVAEYEKLLNESKDLQIPLLIEIEKNISYALKAIRFDLEEEISPLDLKLSKILQKPLNRMSLSAEVFYTFVSKPSKRKQIKRYLFAEIGKGKELTSSSKLYKANKEKIFDCITLEFTPNSFNKGSLKLFSLLSKKGMAVISIPVREFSDIRKS